MRTDRTLPRKQINNSYFVRMDPGKTELPPGGEIDRSERAAPPEAGEKGNLWGKFLNQLSVTFLLQIKIE